MNVPSRNPAASSGALESRIFRGWRRFLARRQRNFYGLTLSVALLPVMLSSSGCILKQKSAPSLAFSERHAKLLEGPLSGEVTRSGLPKEVVDSMMLDDLDLSLTNLDLVAPLYPELVLAKAKVEEAKLEAALRAQDAEIANLKTLQERSFAFVGRIEARRSDAIPSPPKGETADPEILFSDVAIWPPRATGRLLAQLQEALRREAQSRSQNLPAANTEGLGQAPIWGAGEPLRFGFADCAPRFNPAEYVGGSDDVVAAILRAAGWVAPEVKLPSTLPDSEVQTLAESLSIGKKRRFEDCAGVFESKYSRWEFDFLVSKETVGTDVRYYQEIHVRPRMFWASRLVNGPLNGKPELQRTVVFRSLLPLPKVIHLRVFGNIAKPKALTIYNYPTGAPFDDETRALVLENFGVKWAGLKNRLVEFCRRHGLDVRQIDGGSLEDVTALFRIARVWNFVDTTKNTLINVGSTLAATGLLVNGMAELASYDVAEILSPGHTGPFLTSLFLGAIVPGAVLTRRAVDTLEIDYLAQVMRSTKNPALRRAVERLQIFDLVMAGIAIGDSALFVQSNWKSFSQLFYTTHVVRALSESYALFRNGTRVSSELYGKLLSENADHFSKQKLVLEKILAQSRDRMIQALNQKLGTHVRLVGDLQLLEQTLRSLKIYKEAAATDQETEERAARIDALLERIVEAAYCDVIGSASLDEFLADGAPQEEQRRSQAVTVLRQAFSCPRAPL